MADLLSLLSIYYSFLDSCLKSLGCSCPSNSRALSPQAANTMDQPTRMDIDYSLKNIPIPTEKEYKKSLIVRVEEVIKRMRWKAFFYLKGDNTKEETNARFGLKTKNCPPKVPEMKEFEDDVTKMIENLRFRRVSDDFQAQLKTDIQKIKKTEHIIMKADKTRNLYQVSKDQYHKLLHD